MVDVRKQWWKGRETEEESVLAEFGGERANNATSGKISAFVWMAKFWMFYKTEQTCVSQDHLQSSFNMVITNVDTFFHFWVPTFDFVNVWVHKMNHLWAIKHVLNVKDWRLKDSATQIVVEKLSRWKYILSFSINSIYEKKEP